MTVSIICAILFIIPLIFVFMSAKKYSYTTYSPAVLSFILLCVPILFLNLEIMEKIIMIAIFAIPPAIIKSVWGKIEKGRRLIEKKANKNINMPSYTPEYYKDIQWYLDRQISFVSELLTSDLIGNITAATIPAVIAANNGFQNTALLENIAETTTGNQYRIEIAKTFNQISNEIKEEVKSYDMDNIITYAKTDQITSAFIQELLTKILVTPNIPTPEMIFDLKDQLIRYIIKSAVEDTNISFLKKNKLLADSSLHPVGIILNFAYTVGSVACIFLLPAIFY